MRQGARESRRFARAGYGEFFEFFTVVCAVERRLYREYPLVKNFEEIRPSRLMKNSSRRPPRTFGPSSALRNLAVALLWLRFRALISARISALDSVRSISATC